MLKGMIHMIHKKQSESRYRQMSAWAVRGTIILSDGVSDQASGTMEAWGASKDGPPVPRYTHIVLLVLLAHRHAWVIPKHGLSKVFFFSIGSTLITSAQRIIVDWYHSSSCLAFCLAFPFPFPFAL